MENNELKEVFGDSSFDVMSSEKKEKLAEFITSLNSLDFDSAIESLIKYSEELPLGSLSPVESQAMIAAVLSKMSKERQEQVKSAISAIS